jgi:hypothetical protein
MNDTIRLKKKSIRTKIEDKIYNVVSTKLFILSKDEDRHYALRLIENHKDLIFKFRQLSSTWDRFCYNVLVTDSIDDFKRWLLLIKGYLNKNNLSFTHMPDLFISVNDITMLLMNKRHDFVHTMFRMFNDITVMAEYLEFHLNSKPFSSWAMKEFLICVSELPQTSGAVYNFLCELHLNQKYSKVKIPILGEYVDILEFIYENFNKAFRNFIETEKEDFTPKFREFLKYNGLMGK